MKTLDLAQIRGSIGWRRRVVLARTLPLVAAIVALKIILEQLGWEFITISPLHTSIIAGAIFIIGLILAGTVGDYKESERLPTELAAALETIYREGAYVKKQHPTFRLDSLTDTIASIPHDLREDLVHGSENTIERVEQLSASFLEMERLGVAPNYIARLKQEQATIVRNLMRVAYIQRISFLPSAYTLVETIIGLLIVFLLFTRVSTALTDTILLGFISLIFIYILGLLKLLGTPFRSSKQGVDDVSLYQIDRIHERMHGRLHLKLRRKHE